MLPRRALTLLLATAMLATAPPVLASHDGGGASAERDLAFRSVNGNEWWVQVSLSGSAEADVVAVEARDDGGPWVALERKSWGDWARSFHVEPGHRVRFVAHFSDGAHQVSCWFTHPEGVEQCDDGGTADPPPDDGFDAAFQPRNGNEWWIQVHVTANAGVAAVDARIDCGDWRPLELKSWGDWAKSVHAPDGSLVEFRATSASGAADVSGGYVWPGATPAEGCDGGTPPPPPPPDEFDATFRGVKGNQWWVETYVDANAPVAGVEARVAGETWRALEKKSWGAWAKSFHVPSGSLVEFRATADDGRQDLSENHYRWPDATPVPREDDGQWPHEGSYVKYLLDSGMSVPGYSEQRLVWLNLTYQDGAWRGTCEGWDTKTVGDESNRTRVETTATASPPARGPTQVQPGQGVDVALPSCGEDQTFAYVDGRDVARTYHGDVPHLQHGEPVDVPVWRASWEDDGCPCQWRSLKWHPDTGLTVDFVIAYRHSSESGHLVDTDAPISEAETRDPPQPAWPTTGSYAVYQVNLTSDHSDVVEQRVVRFDHVGGAWQATCTDETFQAAPPMGPTDTQPGAKVRPTEVSACRITPAAVVVEGIFPQDTTRNGQFHRATVWWADESDQEEADGEDEDAWWDVNTGLLLRWEDHGGYFRGDEGWLLDTDAPLSSA